MTLRKGNITAGFAVLFMLIVFSLPVLAQSNETIAPGETLRDTLDAETPVQVYAFEAEAGVTYVATAESETTSLFALDIVDASGASLISTGDFSTVNDLATATAAATPEDADTYFILISSLSLVVSGDSIDYALTLTEGGGATTETPAATEVPATTNPAATEEATTDAATGPVSGQLVTTAGFTVSLSWNGSADLDLEIRDPVGGSLYWETPTVQSGGTITPNVNQACANVVTQNATEAATWSPGGIPLGSYEVLVYFQQACASGDAVTFSITPTLDGEQLPVITDTIAPGQVYVSRVVVNQDGSAEVQAPGGIVELETIPYAFADLQAAAQPIALEETLSGFITNDQQFQAYTFEGLPNQLLTVSTFATSGSLDTFVGLYDPNGTLVAFNDDLGVGITDSQISNVLLPSAGVYTVLVTRYGKATGGTEGTYDVNVTQQTVNLSQEFLALPEGSLEVLLLWNTAADVQLLMRDTAGDSVFDDIPRISSGAILAAQGNVNCRISEGTPFSYIYYPQDRQPRPGVYEVEVWFQNACNDQQPVTFNLYVTLNGRQVLRASDTLQPPVFNADQTVTPGDRYLTSFTLNPDGTTLLSDGGIIRGLDTLDYQPEIATAPALVAGEPLAGSITQDNKFDVYAYDGLANTNVTISLNATSGTLDTTLYLVSPSGALIAENDDAVPGENTNSLIADFTLPEDGQYIIIVTHYGALFGGTTGTYTLTLTELG
ncbi:MAG: PPC domain-containing protein [Chloroflexota bacterium]|nr:PPC domain-containing protein [Chloroflexota bacterium]